MAQKIHVCIDLGNDTFKLAAFLKRGKKLTLTGGRVEKIDFAIGDSFKESVPAIADKITDMLSQLNLKTHSVHLYLSLPGPLTFCRLLKLPLVERTKIHQIIQYEAQQQVPFALDEVVWDHEILGSPDPEHLHVMIAAIRQELILELLRHLNKRNLHVELIEASPIASYQCIWPILQSTEETVALINLGARSTNLIICEPHTVWVRTMTMGGEHFTQEIQKELKLGTLEAENLKQKKATLEALETPGSTPVDKRMVTAMEIPAKRLIAELSRSIDFYHAQFSAHPIKKIYLTGGGSQTRYLETYLSKKLSVEVERLNPFQNTRIETGQNEALQNHPFLFTEVMGLAMRLLKIAPLGINLLPKSYLAERSSAKKREYFLSSAVAGLLILASQIFYHHGLVKLKQSRLGAISSTQKELQSYSDEIKNLISQTESYSLQTEEIKKITMERSLWIKIFQELQNQTPSNIWLSKFTTSYIQKDRLKTTHRSQGSPPGMILLSLDCKTTGTYKAASDFRDALEKSPLFKSVQISSANPPLEGVRNFVIQLEIEE